MATSLVNRKMNPALARRIEASVTGQRHQRSTAHRTVRWTSLLRAAVVLGVSGLIGAFYLAVRHEHAEMRQARANLLAQWNTFAATLTENDRGFLDRVERTLAPLQGAYPGDSIAGELRSPGALEAWLARPAVYVRGPLSAFAGSNTMLRTASASSKDTLLLCLLEPPQSRDEKALLAKARLSMLGGAGLSQATPNVIRLYDAKVGLPLLQPAWSERIKDAKDLLTLAQLERELNRAPLALAKRAVRTDLLIAAIDEPHVKAGVTELDGENLHDIRLVVTQLDTDRPLIRLRRTVDPSWISGRRRPEYARELDGCRFALEVRDAVRGSLPQTESTAR